MAEVGETSNKGGSTGQRRCRVEAVVSVVVMWEGVKPGVCAAEAKASQSMLDNVLCVRLANTVHIVANES